LTGRVLVTGLGGLSALGRGADRFWTRLVAGDQGICKLQRQPEDASRIRIGAEVQDYVPEDHFTASELGLLDRFSQYALVAAQEAVSDADLQPAALERAAIVLGTGCGGKETDDLTYQRLYAEGKRRAHPLTIPRGMPCAASSQISIRLGIRGPSFSVTSGCASSNHAVAQAMLLLRSGVVDVALAGGTDAPFTPGLLRAWEALRVLSPDACRPFSQGRNGMILGEGAGIAVLESELSAHRRGAQVYAELAGFGMSSDASHITEPSADGAAAAIQAALVDARMAPEEVDYLNAHGTGTVSNDPTETRAIRQALGAAADRIAVSSTKAAHGHALGAAGALELIATVMAIRHGVVPPTLNFIEPGDGCDLDYVPNRAEERPVRAALSNSFAFGGLNAVLALRA
jgi:nodulation protein E